MECKQQITLNISYPVVFKRDIFSVPVQPFWQDVIKEQKEARAIFFIDENVNKKTPHLQENIQSWVEANEKLQAPCSIKVVPGGEAVKNSFEIINDLAYELTKNSICRHSYVFIIGGGAALDAVGFAASITHRGIRQIRIPTTVLSQDDSAVGVKNGINHFGMKNFLGTFYPPFAVINDSSFLETLDRRDWISGLAEAYKVAIIKDKPFFELLEKSARTLNNREIEPMEEVVKRSAKIHLNHIRTGGDPFELGSARPLDFGHWSAHKLESMSNYELRHGEAVAIGIALDLFCALELNLISEPEVKRILKAMQATGMQLWSDLLLNKDKDCELEVVRGLAEFQEHIGGDLTLTMPNGLGNRVEIHDLPDDVIKNSLKKLQEFTDKF